MKSAAYATALLGAIVMLASALAKTTPWSAPSDALLPILALVAWVVSPFVPIVAAAAVSRSTVGAGIVLALGLAAMLLGGVVYADAFLRHASPTYALLFLSVPVIQWGIGAAALVSAVVLRRRRASAPPA